jgi:hypothetical protein
LYGGFAGKFALNELKHNVGPLQVGTAAVIGTVLVVGVLHVAHSPGAGVNMVKKSQSTMLYDIPNFVYQRTQMHFPQAEENWLNMAAQGKIGDDVKPEHVLNKLNGIISDARTHALTENYVARVKAKKDAMEENYDVYDVHKGKVIHKMYGKQVGGSMTLKPKGMQGQMLAQQSAASEQAMQSFGVIVPAGLKAGDRFIAQIPGHGQELVTVPPHVEGGQEVAIKAPAQAEHAESTESKAAKLHRVLEKARRVKKPAKPLPKVGPPPRIRTSHDFAAKMLDDSLSEHYNAVNHKVNQ